MNAVYLFQDQNSPEIYDFKNLFHLKQLSLLPEFTPEEFSFIVLNVKGVEELSYEIILQFLFNGYLNRNLKFTLILVGTLNKVRFYEKYPKYYILSELNISYQSNTPLDELLIENQNLIHLSKFIELIDESNLSISKPYGSRHQLTNKWGAYKLAHSSGLTYLLEEIESINHEFKKTYFSFLKCKHQIYPTNEPFKELNLASDRPSFLLIDDNHDKGWSLVFEHILAQEFFDGFQLKVHTDFENFKEREEDIISAVLDQIRLNDICGILLDLRLNREEEEQLEFDYTDIQNFSGGKILVAIKEKYPCLPVIIVTASNKVWNAEQLRQTGADGFFVKEDPTIFILPEVSKSNYEGFIKLVNSCFKSYEKLSPFWKHIKEIERDNIITEKPLAGSTTKIKERIEERLYMFLGLIKRGGEDTKFNDRFHYSDIELAFITLWSCLIDIQFCYYDKTDCEPPSASVVNRNPICDIKIHHNISTRLNLTHNLILQERKSPGTGRKSFKTYIHLDYNGGVSRVGVIGGKDNSKNIGEQIAFLLLSFESSPYVNDLTGNSNDVQKMCIELVRLKALRNELYLTHGDEESDFFTKNLRSGSQITLTDCKRLFEIVYFLLKVEIIDMGP